MSSSRKQARRHDPDDDVGTSSTLHGNSDIASSSIYDSLPTSVAIPGTGQVISLENPFSYDPARFARSLQPELKSLDCTLRYVPATSGSYSHAPWAFIYPNAFTALGSPVLNYLELGPGSNQRIGRKVVNKSIYFRGVTERTYYYGGSATASTGGPNSFRVIFVFDKQTNASIPTVDDVLAPPVIAGTGDALDAFQFTRVNNLSSRDRFVVLSDTIFENIGASFAPTEVSFLSKELVTTYSDILAPTTHNTVITGGIFCLVCMSGWLVPSLANPALNITFRLRYTDS